MTSTDFAVSRGSTAREPRQPEAEELAREQEDTRAADRSRGRSACRSAAAPRPRRSRSAPAAVVGAVHDDRIAELVEIAEVDADAMREELLVERDRVGLGAEEVDRQLAGAAAGEPARRASSRPRRRTSRPRAVGAGAVRQRQPQAGDDLAARPQSPSACSGPGAAIYSARRDVERPQRDVRAQPVAAGDRAGRARDRSRRDRSRARCGCPRARPGSAKGGDDLGQQRRRRRRQIVRDQLLEQVVGELRRTRA